LPILVCDEKDKLEAGRGPSSSMRLTYLISAILATCLMLSLAASAFAQTSASPSALNETGTYLPTLTFDVASVRQCAPGPQSNGFRNPPHNSHVTGTCLWASQLIGWAYGVDYRTQLIGGPEWLRTSLSNEVRFDVEAASDGVTDDKLARLSDEQARLEKQHMLRMLLRDRFHLRVHSETREEPAFALRVAKSGHKLKQGLPPPPRPDGKTGPWPAPLESDRDPRGIIIAGHGASISNLVEVLPFHAHRIVVDQTGITGTYNFSLQFHGTVSDMLPETDSMWPPLETAIREQLGLELRDTKAPLQVIVIDHIEMPSAN
jgi:uncharacterized protein (TIGR03435 family)